MLSSGKSLILPSSHRDYLAKRMDSRHVLVDNLDPRITPLMPTTNYLWPKPLGKIIIAHIIQFHWQFLKRLFHVMVVKNIHAWIKIAFSIKKIQFIPLQDIRPQRSVSCITRTNTRTVEVRLSFLLQSICSEERGPKVGDPDGNFEGPPTPSKLSFLRFFPFQPSPL